MRTPYEDVLGRGGFPLEDEPRDGSQGSANRLARTRTAQRLGAGLLVATAFVAFAWISWRKLGSLIVDGGHELDVPRRLLDGAALYRDIFWNWGPLAPWVNAGLYRAFGVHSDTLMWAGIVTAAVACLGLYLLARCFVGPFTSAWVAITFLIASAFAQRIPTSIFNFVAPYNFSATYGITLSIWSVLLLVRHARSGNPVTLAASAALAGLVALTKLEPTFAVVAAHGAFLATVLPRPAPARVIAWGCGLAVAAAGYGVAAHQSHGHVWHSLVELLNGGSSYYIARSMGVRELGMSVLQIAVSVIGWVGVISLAGWLAKQPAAPRDRRLVALAWIALFLVPAFIVREKFFRAAPFLLAAGVLWIILSRRREGESALDGRWREHLVVWAFALAALPRLVLRTGVDHYGFYLLPPTLVCVAVGITDFIGRRGGTPRSRRVLAAAACTVLAGVALDALIVAVAKFSRPMAEIRTARVWRLVPSGGAEAALVPYLSQFPPGTIATAVPDGAGLIFAAGLTPPDDRMIAYIPMHLHGLSTERSVLEAWERRPPQIVVHWDEDQSSVFGFAGFGKDYGVELGRWISEHYQVAREFPGPTRVLVPRNHPG